MGQVICWVKFSFTGRVGVLVTPLGQNLGKRQGSVPLQVPHSSCLLLRQLDLSQLCSGAYVRATYYDLIMVPRSWYHNQVIPKVNSIKYLGVTMERTLKLIEPERRLHQAKACLHSRIHLQKYSLQPPSTKSQSIHPTNETSIGV